MRPREYRILNQEHEEELGRLLLPREKEEFQIRTSVTGNSLARQPSDFAPSEEEFRSIFRLVRKYEEETGRVGGLYGMLEVKEGTKASAAQDMRDRLHGALGEERFLEFERLKDRTYRDLVQVADHHGLPPAAAVRAYEVEQASRQGGEPQEGSPEERRKALAAVLGEEAVRTYQLLRQGLDPEAELDP